MEKRQVAEMFDSIAPRYDLLNRVLSMGIDKGWRRKLVKMLAAGKPATVLDVATGTGDLAIACLAANPTKITGVDISDNMLQKGREKIAAKGLTDKIELQHGDSENLNFASGSFDAATVAFGIRNFENLSAGLGEMCRVLRPGGKIYILEFTMPRNAFIGMLYRFYFFKVLPVIGRMVSKHSAAYDYLPESVQKFPQYEALTELMQNAGFTDTSYRSLTFGIATIYTGTKKS